MASILAGAKPIGWEYPDGSKVYPLLSSHMPMWAALDVNKKHVPFRSRQWTFATPEKAAAALAAIGQGPASVKEDTQPS